MPALTNEQWKQIADLLPNEVSHHDIAAICANIIWAYAPKTVPEDLTDILLRIIKHIELRKEEEAHDEL